MTLDYFNQISQTLAKCVFNYRIVALSKFYKVSKVQTEINTIQNPSGSL